MELTRRNTERLTWMKTLRRALIFGIALCCNGADRVESFEQPASAAASRRAFLTQSIVASGCGSILGWAPPGAEAYEFVDVGGGQGSAETKAMNIQAYETNNRLERGGFKLDTPTEQSRSLEAALADYSYDASVKNKNDKNKQGKSERRAKKQ